MNRWDYIFPKDDEIIIWGAGKKGIEWFNFLRNIDRNVKCFFDIKMQGNVENIPILKPKQNENPRCILLISPVDSIDNIFEQAKSLGFYNIQIGTLLDLYSKETIKEFSLKDLFFINRERVYVIAVRYLAIENYYNRNDYGFKLYKKMQLIRNNKNFAEEQFRNLIKSFEQYGQYDKNSPITVLDNLKYFDGAHRISLSLYHNIKNVTIRILPQDKRVKFLDFSLNWFVENGFNEEEIKIIKDKANELLEKYKLGEYVGIFWGDSSSFFKDAILDLKNYGVITNIMDYSYKREEYNDIVRYVHSVNDAEMWKVNKKILYLNKYPPHILSFHLKMVIDYFVNMNSDLISSKKVKEIKRFINSKYQSQFKKFFLDDVLYIADNLHDSDIVDFILSPCINFNNMLEKIKMYNYAFLGVNMPYVSENFPNSIPIGRAIDVLVHNKDYKLLISQLKDCASSLEDKYEVEFIEISITNTQMRYLKGGQLFFLLNIFCDIEELKSQFIEDALIHRIEIKNYFKLNTSYEYIYRLLKFSLDKNDWTNYNYLQENKSFFNENFIEKYAKIELENIL